MRADKKKSQDKVVAEMLKDPLATEREIAERAGVSNGTAHARIKEIEQRTIESCLWQIETLR